MVLADHSSCRHPVAPGRFPEPTGTVSQPVACPCRAPGQPLSSAACVFLASCSASYKNKENIDLTKVPSLARHENDVGSTEVQVARLTARVQQISSHLKSNRKDFSGQRGLQQVLNQRKKLLQYLYKKDRWAAGRWQGVGPRQGTGAGHTLANTHTGAGQLVL